MANNCLVTKLKGTVDNTDLQKYGAWKITRENAVPAGWSYSTDKIFIHGETNSYVDITSDEVTEVINSYDGTTIPLPAHLIIAPTASNTRQIAFSQKGSIYISSKYDIWEFSFSNPSTTEMKVECSLSDFCYKNNPNAVTSLYLEYLHLDGNIKDLKKLTSLKILRIFRNNLTGDVSELKDIPLTYLSIGYNNIHGNISSISNLTQLTQLNFQDTDIQGTATDLGVFTNTTELTFLRSNITGSVEDFVTSQIAHGRTSVSESAPLYSNAILSRLTFGGSMIPDTTAIAYGTLIWESASKIAIFCGGLTIGASTVVYAKGYSSSEMDIWEQAGKTVIVIN